MEYRNARYLEDGRIDCEYNHPKLGRWVPFTASPTDSEAHGRELHAAIIANGDAAPYVAPPPPTYDEVMADWRSVARCEMLQLQDHIIDAGLFDAAEEASQTVDPKWRIRWEARGGVVVHRSQPLLDEFAGMIDLTPKQVDEMPVWHPPKPEIDQ